MHTTTPLSSRKAAALTVACQRCKRRKQKCDGDVSTNQRCSNCRKASCECVYDTQPTIQYVRGLEKKIKSLELELRRMQTSSASSVFTAVPKAQIPPESSQPQLFATHMSSIGIESMFLGQNLLKENIAGAQAEVDIDWADELKRLTSDKTFMVRLFDVYIELVHTKYPVLLRSYMDQLKSSVTSTSFLRSEPPDEESKRDMFVALMILAIGARVISESEKSTEGHTRKTSTATKKPDPHAVFFINALMAQSNFSNFLGSSSLKDVQILVLMVIYLLRTPNSTMIWDMVRFTMGNCVHLGLHRKNTVLFESDPCAYQLRTRVFWSVYALERVISNSFGRPYSLNDRDIDVDLPLDVDESAEDDPNYLRFARYTKLGSYTDPDATLKYGHMTKKSLSLAIHLFKLRRIDSEIQNSIYRVDEPHQSIPLEVINVIQQKMKTWVHTLPDNLNTFESDYCLYLFNKQICSLTQPFVKQLDPENMLFTETIRSCIDICLWSRRVHQNSSYQQSFISLQTAFLSGVTLAYALLSGKLPWSFEVGEGLRNCSSVLYLFAERSESACKYRDIFEALVFQVDQKRHQSLTVHGGNSSIRGADLFGQNILKEKLQRIHKEENLKLFEEISKQTFVFPGVGDVGSSQVGPDEDSGDSTLDGLFENIWKFESLQKDNLDFW